MPDHARRAKLQLMSEKTRKIIAELRYALEKIYGRRLHSVVLYGSRAREDEEPCSDIDVLVVLNGGVDPGAEISRTGNVVADLSLRNDLVVSCLFVSADRFAREQSPLLMNVRREGVVV